MEENGKLTDDIADGSPVTESLLGWQPGGDYVDPQGYLYDDGKFWVDPIGDDRAGTHGPHQNEGTHATMRNISRRLMVSNEFAINAVTNRVSYVVGTGHSYSAVSKDTDNPRTDLEELLQEFLDEFTKANKWGTRQAESWRRRERDGEVFVRLFYMSDGTTKVRFVEPEQVKTPTEQLSDPAVLFGIRSDVDDVETIEGYYVDGEFIESQYIQHRKANVDLNVRRGMSSLFPVRKNFQRIERLLRDATGSVTAQAAVAMIRYHRGRKSSAESFRDSKRDTTYNDPYRANTQSAQYQGGARVIDANVSTKYEFPNIGMNGQGIVTIIQAELRAIAAGFVMPEFMLTSDASNANFASTMVAEGPAAKHFERLQDELITHDVEVIESAVMHASNVGVLPADILDSVSIQAEAPTAQSRDRKADADASKIENELGVSRDTLIARMGYSPEEERQNREKEDAEKGDMGIKPVNPLAMFTPPEEDEPEDVGTDGED